MTRTRNSYRDLESWWWRRHRLPWMSSRRHYRSGRFPSPCCIRHRSGNSCSETWSWRTLKQTCFPQLSSSERSPLSKSPHRRPTIGLYTSAIEKRNTLNEHRRTKDARHNVCAIEEETRTITVSTRLTQQETHTSLPQRSLAAPSRSTHQGEGYNIHIDRQRFPQSCKYPILHLVCVQWSTISMSSE